MTLEGDVERLKTEMGRRESECRERHDDLQETITDIKTMLAKMQPTFQMIEMRLQSGSSIFDGHEERIKKIEFQMSSWKGIYLGVTATAAFFGAVLSYILNLAWAALFKS